MTFQTRDWINEPASVVPEIVKTAESRPDKSTDLNLIYCRFSKQLPEQSEKVAKDLLTLIENLDTNGIMTNDNLFIVLKNKRYMNAKEIYQKYWEKVADDLARINANDQELDLKLSNISYQYCLMQKSLVNRSRSHKFESILRELALLDVKFGVSAWKPNRLTRLSTFIIGFACDSTSGYVTLPEYFVRTIEENAHQFGFKEVIDIATGIEFFHRNGIPKTLVTRKQLKLISSINDTQ